MATPEEQYAQKRTVYTKPLTPSAQVFYKWYLKNDIEDRRKYKEMEDMDAFVNLYTQNEITQDKQWVKKQGQKYNQKDFTERAEIAEYIIKTFARDSEWFGQESIVSETSKYDDRKNGTDFVIEWENSETEERDCALAVDVTVTSERSVLYDKIAKTKRGIKNGTLTSIKYFNSEISGATENLSLIPRVIIVFDKDNLDLLSEELITYTKGSNFYNQTRDHYMSLFVLKTSKQQLEKQLEYLQDEKMLAKDPSLYDAAQKSIQQILERVSQALDKKEKSLSEEKIQQAYDALEKIDFSSML
jgi:hypothetical protein